MNFALNRLMKPGDWLVTALGALGVIFLFLHASHGIVADKAVIKSHGEVFAQLSLARDSLISVPGPLGTSVVEIRNGQAKIASDPSPRQYCVQAGWLKNAGDAAICLPNQVSLELEGREKRYDSLNY